MLGATDITLTVKDRVAVLLLNRPDKRNAITVAMWRAIPRMLQEAAAHSKLRLLVVRGAGGSFAAGADIAEFQDTYATRDAALANHRIIQEAMSAVESFPMPTLAAIEGACVGGGCGLALACDLRYGTPSARFGITPGKLGLVYGVSDTRRLVQAVGLSNAKEILFTGRLINADRARSIGLIDKVVDDQMDAAIADLHAALAAASSHTARTTKSILRMLNDGLRDDNDRSRTMFAEAFEGDDLQEGIKAFLERRPPIFP
jgi:enoyl-CoA hydratase/carnithine racemase